MDDAQYYDNFPPLATEQIRDLAAMVHEDFGGSLSLTAFNGKLLMLLEDVPGCESCEVAAAIVELAWAEYPWPGAD